MDKAPRMFLTKDEAAEELRVSRDYIDQMIGEGRLGAVRLSERVTRIPLAELERLAASLRLGVPDGGDGA